MGWKAVASIVLIFVGLVAMSHVGYSYGYDSGMRKGYDLGLSEGHLLGNSSGYKVGYNDGYSQGFSKGNLTGYELGNRTGYNDGYSQGFSKGNLTGYELGNRTGYTLGYQKGVLDGAGTGYAVRDPTFHEALTFLANDKTDQNPYVLSNYTCVNFAADVKNNAFATGYKCGIVYIYFNDGGHAVICFNTTDRGLIFIEPQDDKTVTLKIGESYWGQNGYVLPSYDDKILRHVIAW